jgi:hypothetical protein
MKTRRKLSFDRNTLRRLAAEDMTQVNGGGSNLVGGHLCSGCVQDVCLTQSRNWGCGLEPGGPVVIKK